MAAMQQAPSAKSLEEIRTNARRRLIGAIILVVLAIAILPWVLETKPRESQTEVQVNTAAVALPPAQVLTPPSPQSQPFPPAVVVDGVDPFTMQPAPSVTLPPPPNNPFFVLDGTPDMGAVDPGRSQIESSYFPDSGAEQVSAQRTTDGYAIRPANRIIIASKLKPEQTAPSSSQVSDAARAAALLGEPMPRATRPTTTGTSTSTGGQVASAGPKFVIQVGAYSDITKANEVRARLTMAGYTSYTEEANTNAGKVTRVRIGPVNGRAKADEMAKKIGALGLPVSILPS